MLEFNEDISPSLSSILPFAEPIEDDSPTTDAVFAATTETKPGVAKGNIPNPYNVEFKVATDAATPDILDELELIPLVFEFIFDSKLSNLLPTSTVPIFIDCNADIVSSA